MLSFSEILKALKNGHKVARSGWNGKGMWLFLVQASEWGMGSNVPFDWGKEGCELCPWIGMKTADNKFVPWLASQTDILANDWMVL